MYILWTMTNNKAYLSTQEAADFLKVSKKTLMRWDSEGHFPTERESVTSARIYHLKDIEMAKKWLDLREKHRMHLKKLPNIQKELDRILVTNPLIPGEPDKHFWGIEEIKKPFEAMNKWEEEEKKIFEEYSQFNDWKYRKITR